ncbi:MAG: GNAT family N-acetyltransferase [Cyanobacteria bacterium P01_A01_bin.135]
MRFLQLTPLTPDFLPEIVRLDQACFGGLWTPSAYQREIESHNSVLAGLVEATSPAALGPTVAVSDAAPRLLAMGCLWAICEEAHITLLAVHERHRRQGMGQILLGNLLQQAQQRGLEWATLEVRTTNTAALTLYKAFGFTSVGRRQRYYRDTGEDALILWCNELQEPGFTPLLNRLMAQAIARLHQRGWLIQGKDIVPDNCFQIPLE